MEKLEGLALLRAPFPAHQISKLPKPTKSQTEEIKQDFKKGIRCQVCGGWHHKDVIHLDYVGHAALTDRLLDVDPNWHWEPVAFDSLGLPALDNNYGLWIRLTVLGVTRLGYGHADGKVGGDAIKEAIGDSLRNAAMRFGAALDLWHKGDLHIETKDTSIQHEPVKSVFTEEDYQNLCAQLSEEISEIKIGINLGDFERAASAWLSIDESDKMLIWRAPKNGGCFTTAEREAIKSKEFREAGVKAGKP